MGYTLGDIVREFLIETGDSNLNRYPRYYQFGTSFLREQNQDYGGAPKMVQLCINDNDTVDLPNDYLQYRVIGTLDHHGNIHSLGRNDKMPIGNVRDCAKIQPIDRNDSNWLNQVEKFGFASIDGLSQNYRNGEFMGKMFGVNGGNNIYGEYRIDLANGVIQLAKRNVHSHSIILEYIADINAINEDFEVSPFIIEALKAWISWKSIVNDRNRSLGEKQMAFQNYKNADRWAKIRIQRATISEWAAAFRSGNTASVKW
jgi:hypothetical protein